MEIKTYRLWKGWNNPHPPLESGDLLKVSFPDHQIFEWPIEWSCKVTEIIRINDTALPNFYCEIL